MFFKYPNINKLAQILFLSRSAFPVRSPPQGIIHLYLDPLYPHLLHQLTSCPFSMHP